MKWLIVTVLFYYVSCEDTVSVREPSAGAAAPLADSQNRIIGGLPTTIEVYPYMAQVLANGQPNCGGMVLTARHVLSAAHCFINQNGAAISPSVFTVRVGSTYSMSGGSVHKVSTIVLHESYNNPTSNNDVAVVVLASRIRSFNSSTVRPAIVPPSGYVVPDNASVVAIGWGRTVENIASSVSPSLRHVSVRKVSRSECAARYSALGAQQGNANMFPVTTSMLCAGLLNVGGADACQGDSGGPLVYNGVVVGVTSWGAGCGNPSYPGVYARVASYTTWITSTVQRYNGAPTVSVNFLLLVSLVTSIILTNSTKM
ncbi:unnamed protein product [Plutella xylostella]|uniref:(diamondback moth) hypothetical protein n=1 Tax=Plutella xylostella TaxID=51655 RepID=A0A8S4GE43_PLUXY|nr:unnamed protein product [Plutella xylostella]